jgi:hypothetical protein
VIHQNENINFKHGLQMNDIKTTAALNGVINLIRVNYKFVLEFFYQSINLDIADISNLDPHLM